jgi:hypothetical protein
MDMGMEIDKNKDLNKDINKDMDAVTVTDIELDY